MSKSILIGVCAAAGLTSVAAADGYLWFGAEYVGEGNIYRYNIETGLVDLTIAPNIGVSDHLNNCATDGQFLYVGTPTSQVVGICDIYTGALQGTVTHSTSLAGHKEDGASDPATGHLWRTTWSGGLLHEYEPDGTVVNSFALNTLGLVGLEWANGQLYASSYSNGSIGSIEFSGNDAIYTVIPWAIGGAPPANSSSALAWDACADILYLINGFSVLYTVTFDNGEATATELVDLKTVGYPTGGLIDGMGWAPPLCGADTDGNDVVNVTDLLELLSKWGPCPPSCSADVDCNGVVNVTDLLTLLGAWGPCGP